MWRDNLELQRTDSICLLPETQLLDHVRANQVPKIRSILAKTPSAVNAVIGYPYDKPILHIACHDLAERILPKTIETLLELGADPYYSDEVHNHKEALHFAALGANPNVLQIIVNHIKREKINSLSGGNTALNLLIKEGDAEQPGFIDCVRILLSAGIDVNKTDSKNLTPIFWAAKKEYKDVVRIILHESKQDVDLDNHKQRGKSARDYIAENNMEISVDPALPQNNNAPNSCDLLFGFLKEYNEDAFSGCKYLASFADADDGVVTLLQMATKRGLTSAVESLLNIGADPNLITPKTPTLPIEIAAIEGYHAILALLVSQDKIVIPSGILTELLRYIDGDVTHEDVNYGLCYSLLMQHKDKLDVNILDMYNSTPLHYAARYGGTDRTLDLLRAGASMACRNKYGSLPVEDIDANTLETHLNECLETKVEGNIDKENLIAVYNYKTLMPPRRPRRSESKEAYDAEAANKLLASEIEHLASETQVIAYMSKSPELKHLLKHPVVTSFLYIKWHRIRWFFYSNLAFYVAFCLSLILYILLIYRGYGDDSRQVLGYALSAFLCITFTLLVFRELFQALASPSTYFRDLENWLELVLIVLTAFVLFQRSSSDDARKQVAAFAILLAAFELVLLIGQHPQMSTNIVMLRTVSLNFFKFLLWYSILILAFSLSFYTLFRGRDESNDTNATAADGDDDPDFFIDPGLSLFKTIVMLTGEFDAGSIQFDVYPVTSHIIFMLFVFMIAIILFNLLNGLAVSDTHLIKSNAELVGHIARIEHIAYIESMLLGNVLPNGLVDCLRKCCCLPFNVTNRVMVPGFLVRRVCLFPYFLKNYKLMIYPNKQCKIALAKHEDYSDGEGEGTCIGNCMFNIYLDKQTAKRTKQLIRTKKEVAEKGKSQKTVLEKQEQVIEQQQRYIDELRKEQGVILNKLDYIITNMSVQV